MRFPPRNHIAGVEGRAKFLGVLGSRMRSVEQDVSCLFAIDVWDLAVPAAMGAVLEREVLAAGCEADVEDDVGGGV